MKLYPELRAFIASLEFQSIDDKRSALLHQVVEYVKTKEQEGAVPKLHFICTHNSRRSQLAQIWSQLAAEYYGVEVKCFSGGTEVTAFNPRAVAALERSGLKVEKETGDNPEYRIFDGDGFPGIRAYSKYYDAPENPDPPFAAIMTCGHAEENCPFIPGTEQRLSLNYEDPKAYDGTAEESEKYDERNRQIATEMFYIFSKVIENE